MRGQAQALPWERVSPATTFAAGSRDLIIFGTFCL